MSANTDKARGYEVSIKVGALNVNLSVKAATFYEAVTLAEAKLAESIGATPRIKSVSEQYSSCDSE